MHFKGHRAPAASIGGSGAPKSGITVAHAGKKEKTVFPGESGAARQRRCRANGKKRGGGDASNGKPEPFQSHFFRLKKRIMHTVMASITPHTAK
jgi:hypothetical protein